MSADFDLSEVFALANDLGRVDDLGRELRQVIQKGALNIKQQMQREAAGVAHAPGFPSAITFETKIAANGVEAEIGPVKGGAGSLALLYFGNSKTGPRLPDPVIALNKEAQATEQFLAKAAANVLGR